MHRAWYLIGWGYVAITSTILWKSSIPDPPHLAPGPVPPLTAQSTAVQWFTAMKPHCNSLEVELAVQRIPPPAGWEGSGFGASCWAIAGQIERARELVLQLPQQERILAANIIFNVGHPIADAGDDRSAGPIMQLVVEFQPDNYMALYHAGMSWYATGNPQLARRHLEEFLRRYDVNDGWKSNAQQVLSRLNKGGVP